MSTFFQKQMAQEAIRRVDGVEQIENLLQVNWVEEKLLAVSYQLLARDVTWAKPVWLRANG